LPRRAHGTLRRAHGSGTKNTKLTKIRKTTFFLLIFGLFVIFVPAAVGSFQQGQRYASISLHRAKHFATSTTGSPS
jgi:hypothetical protein